MVGWCFELALCADVALGRFWSRVHSLPGVKRRMAHLAVPSSGRVDRSSHDGLLPAATTRASAPRQAQRAPEARLFEHRGARRPRGPDRTLDLQAPAIRVAHGSVRRVSGSSLLAFL